jgi:heme exporter protein D
MSMLIIALVLALIGLVALVFAVVTSNELVAWVCIGASVLGVILLIVDAVRERQQRDAGGQTQDDRDDAEEPSEEAEDYPDEADADQASGSDATEESAAARDESAK